MIFIIKVYPVEKSVTIELYDNCSLTGDPIERLSHYSLIFTQIDFWEVESKKFSLDEIMRKTEQLYN